MKATLWLLSLLVLAYAVTGEDVRFGSRLFTVASDKDCEDQSYDDPKQTGSYLLYREGQNSGQHALSMDVLLVHYKAPGAQCFRAHPVFIDCVQAALTKLKSDKYRAIVIGGYRPPSDVVSGDAEDVFSAAGTSLILAPYNSTQPSHLVVIAQYLLRYCPAKLERIQRNLGIVLKANTLRVFMGGPTDPPLYKVDGYPLSQSDFTAMALSAINEGLGLKLKASNCTRFTPLASGEKFPLTATSAESTVGSLDVPVTRDSPDFLRLVQYVGTAVQFENVERTASWCGQPSNPCLDCRFGPVDATLASRCMSRMMTARMRNFLVLLQKLTTESLSNSVLVTQAWEEDYEGHTASTTSLHREGRAVLLALASDNTPNNLATLTQLAMCAGADFMQHNGDHLFVAVQRQQGDVESEVQFSQAAMIRVLPPTSRAHLLSLPPSFTEADHAAFPVLDSNGKESLQLASHTKLSQFVSDKSRYLRINPFLVQCYSELQDYFVKREYSDGPVTLQVVQAFMTTPDRDLYVSFNDPRYLSPILGLSFEIRADSSQSSKNVSLAELARLAVTQCTPIFQKNDAQLGVGLYPDRVYVDMRETFTFWNPAGGFIPAFKDAIAFKAYLTELFQAAQDSRIIDPDDPEEAELLAEPTLRQSVDYRYVTPARISRRTSISAGECVPNPNTQFCQDSQTFRQALVEAGWTEATKKHNYRNIDQVKEAFDNCFSLCATCLSGSVYESKLEHCSNYLHWSPFEMAPDNTPINLFPRERPDLRKCACQGTSAHCIEDSALFLLMVNMFEATFRQDPESSVEQEVYPQTENPSPVAELLNQLYATHHTGQARIWVYDDSDITSMRYTLQKLMVYNVNVTDVVVYVKEVSTIEAVEAVLQSLILDWTTSSSPRYSREYVAPFTVVDMEPHCRITSKRSLREHSVRDEMIAKIKAQEDRYLHFDL